MEEPGKNSAAESAFIKRTETGFAAGFGFFLKLISDIRTPPVVLFQLRLRSIKLHF